jgi:hypothetical protein
VVSPTLAALHPTLTAGTPAPALVLAQGGRRCVAVVRVFIAFRKRFSEAFCAFGALVV